MNREKGSITVFLTLVSVLILALLGTLVETARFTACKNHGARTLRTASEALLTEYSRPLYENYHLFFLESAGTPYEKVIADYANDSLSVPMLSGEMNSVEVENITYLGDDGAEALQKEINTYMSRKVTKAQLEKVLTQSKKLGEIDSQAKEIEETIQEEKEVAQLDMQVLELMKLIDGVTVVNGVPRCENAFVKMFVTEKVQGQNFSITEPVVWNVVKEKLDDTTSVWENWNTDAFYQRVVKVRQITESAMEKSKQLKMNFEKIGSEEKQMAAFINSLEVLSGNLRVLQQTEVILQSEDSEEEKQKQLVTLWKDYDTKSIAFQYTGVGSTGGGDNPKDSFSEAWEKGILNLVCQNPAQLSQKQVEHSDIFRTYYEEQAKTEESEDKITEFLEKDEVNLSGTLGDMGGYAMDEFCLDTYIQQTFDSYLEQQGGWEHALDYQWEYVVAGKNSDIDNFQSVLHRILLIRVVINYFAIYKDTAKREQAYGAATALVGFTCMEPLVRFTQLLIILIWSFTESLVDIAGILQGRDVPILKSSSQVLTSFPELFLITQEAINNRAKKFGEAGKKTFGYNEYILLFLATTKQSTRLYRIMDLIQWDMVKNGYTNFQLGNCVYGFQATGKFTFPAKFFRLVVVEKMLGREMNQYYTSSTISVSY